MKNLDAIYWRSFNALGRFVGLCFLVGGVIGALSFIPVILDQEATVNSNGIPTTDIGIKIMCLVMFLVVTGLGALMIKAKPFYPPGSEPKNK